MAIVNRTDLKVQKRLSPEIELPRDRYTLAIKSETFDLSKGSGQPMVTRILELKSPTVVSINGAEVSIAGTEFIQYLTLGPTEKMTLDENIDKFLTENAKLGLKSDSVDTQHPIPTPKEIQEDPSLSEQSAVGKVVDACCGSEEYSPRKSPTPEQKKARQQGDFIMVNGKKITRFKPRLIEIYGLSNGASEATTTTTTGGTAGAY